MRRKKIYRNTILNLEKIINTLKYFEKNEEIATISKIAKFTGLHKWSVSRIIDLYLKEFVDILNSDNLGVVGINFKIVKLRKDIDINRLLKFLKYKKYLD